MLKETIRAILFNINQSIFKLEEKEINKKTAIQYLELDKMKEDFEKYLKAIEEKEEKEQEENASDNNA